MISDRVAAHLVGLAQQPDLDGTPYTIVREIGRGGMAVVYEAVDTRLERTIALKVLALELSSPENARRMRDEASTIANIEHPGIVPIHDVGELSDGRVFYTMKLVRGDTLSDSARRSTTRSDRLRVFLQICDAVASANSAGVIHRDLKPSNVMVGPFGEVLVMDWGVAARVDSAGEIAGTHGFMPPEQLRGEAAGPTTDIFALGAILQFLSGSTPRPLAAVIAKAMSAAPEKRYQDARELAADVARFLDGEPVSAYRENVLERLGRWLRRNLPLVSIIVAYLVMRLIVFAWLRR